MGGSDRVRSLCLHVLRVLDYVMGFIFDFIVLEVVGETRKL